MKLALDRKGKLDNLTGDTPQPGKNDHSLQKWKSENSHHRLADKFNGANNWEPIFISPNS